MERAFSIFHEYGLAFAFYLKHYSLLRTIPEARSELSLALGDMLALAIEITIFCDLAEVVVVDIVEHV